MKILSLFLFSTFFMTSLFAADLYRVDTGKIENYKPHSKKIEVIITEDCAYCVLQIAELKKCMKTEDVVILIDNYNRLNDIKLKRLIIQKNIPYPTYTLNKEIEKYYGYKRVTPLGHYNTKKGYVSKEGVVTCGELTENKES